MLALMLALVETPEEQILFEKIYHAHRKDMKKAAYYILKDYHLAENAVNEAFFRLARRFSSFEINGVETDETKGLVMILVKNEARRIWKEEKRQRGKSLSFEEELWQGDYSREESLRVEDDHILTDIRVRKVREEIENMGPTYRDVLYLFLVEDQSIRDIAAELGLSVSAVKKRLERGKRLLKERMSEWGEGEEDE